MEMFEDKYRTNMSREQAIKLGLEALMGATEEGSLNTLAVEIGVVSKKDPFNKIDVKMVSKYVDQIKK